MLKRTLPSQRIVVSCILSLHRVLVVTNVRACTNPSSTSFLGSRIWVHQRPHSMVIKRVRFDQINDIEPIVFASFCIRHTEVIPLSVTPGVVIRLQNEIILIFIHLNSPSKISRFKSWLKHQSVVICSLWHIKWSNFSFRGLTLLIRRWIDRIVNNSVH